MHNFKWLPATAVFAVAAFGSTANAALVGDWGFNGSLADSLGGNDAVLIGTPTQTATGIDFGEDDGVSISLAGLTSTDSYGIKVQFNFDSDDNGYQRIMSFDGRDDDYGMYVYDNYFYFYDYGDTELDDVTFGAGESIEFLLNRDGATNTLTGYLSGTKIWEVEDTEGYGIITEPNQNVIFFLDDGGENGPGFLDNISIYDAPTSPTAVPVPAAVWLLGSGLVGFMGLRRKLGIDARLSAS